MAGIQTNALDLARIQRRIQTVKDYDKSMMFIDPNSARRKRLNETGNDPSMLCSRDAHKLRRAGTKLFGRFTLAEVAAKNNVLSEAGSNPGIVDAHPDLIETLDRYADDVSIFDLRCPVLFGIEVEPNVNGVKALFLESVGSYWLAKGENFGASDNDPVHLRMIESDRKNTIAALCKAQLAFSKALKSLELSQDKTVGDPRASRGDEGFTQTFDQLDSEITMAATADSPLIFQRGWDRARNDLSAFSEGDKAEVCK